MPPSAADPPVSDPPAVGPSAGGPSSDAGPRPWHAAALLLGGAGLAAFAGTRGWAGGSGSAAEPVTGAGVVPWLHASALVGLAGVGALPATRGVLRRLVGVLLAAVGVAVVAGAVRAFVLIAPAGARWVWPLACVLGGLTVVAGGLLTAVRGHRWPAMGSRYERGSSPPGQRLPMDPAATKDVWDALDRGEDPTLT